MRRLLLVALLLVSGGCATGGYTAVPDASPAQIPDLEAQRERTPDRVSLLVRLGAAYRSADRMEDAARTLERAREIQPTASNATLLLGFTYEDLGRWGDARDLYTRYLELAPDSPITDRLRGRIQLAQRRQIEETVREALAREREIADVPAPTTIAVFPFRFEGTDPDLAPLSHALAGMLTTDLAQSSRFTVLERTHIHALMSEMQLADEGLVDPSTAARSGRVLGAGRIVQGRLGGDESRIDLSAAVVRVTSADPEVTPVGQQASIEELFDMEKRLVLDLFESMGVTLTTAERERILERRTDNLQALLAYGRGLESAQVGNFREAARHFTEAATLDPDFAIARIEADEAEEISDAEETGTSEVASEASQNVGIAGVDEAVAVVESAARRDPAQEVLRTEGLQRVITLEIIIVRPGGEE